jgi:hypothetical protein
MKDAGFGSQLLMASRISVAAADWHAFLPAIARPTALRALAILRRMRAGHAAKQSRVGIKVI